MSQATSSSDTYLNSNLFSGYYLDERVADLDAWDCDDDAQEALGRLQEMYNQEGGLLPSYKEEDVLSKWIDEVLDVLGFDSLSETNVTAGRGEIDRTLFASSQDRIDAAHLRQDGDLNGMYSKSVALLEAKKWNTDFGKRFNEGRQYRDASHQIKFYLERTPEDVKWGILTDGCKWRLYGTKDYETQTYYEIDLPELLESGSVEQFKYFYVFFRAVAFEEIGGSTFLDEVWNESETAAQELGEDLQDNVFTALRVLGGGFVEKNDLRIDPDDDAALDELKEQSLVLLYRLMFILYAESRGLIDPDSPRAEDEYRSNFSLEVLRDDILEEIDNARGFDEAYSSYSTTMWSRMEDLFRLIDSGEQELGIPAYNGGLFDHDQHAFLTENEVSNRHLAEVIYRLSTTEADDGSYVPADYADLDTRHLGTIYEGLLEHEFRIAPKEYAAVSEDGGQVWKPATEVTVADAVESVEKGELYVVNDEGERKATGAYYTPDYVVTYIVEETVDPLLEDIEDDLRKEGLEPGTEPYVYAFADRVLELKVLDPAMGSGHFLTKATGYLADAVMQEVRKVEKVAGVFDEQDVRRRVSKECIYGVDLNGMAVELAKLSMWLETLAADQPLAFLDHHLKMGNSLVGSDITEVLSNDAEDNGGQLTLHQAFARVRQSALDHVMDLVQELLSYDNETLEDIKSMEALYAEIRSDPLYERLFEMANVHTAEQFGVDVPKGSYERMAGAIEDKKEWAEVTSEDWFVSAQATAGEETFFHWELEFPEVFFGVDGEKIDSAGFDAVIGNPPYSKDISRNKKEYFHNSYNYQKYQLDRYLIFMEKSIGLGSNSSNIGLITPNTWLTNLNFDEMREHVLNSTSVLSFIVYDQQVFPEVTVESVTFILSKKISKENQVSIRRASQGRVTTTTQVDQSVFTNTSGSINISTNPETIAIEEKFSDYTTLSDICEINLGTKPFQKGKGDPPQTEEIVETKPFVSETEKNGFRPLLRGSLIERHFIKWNGNYWIKFGDWLAEPRYSAKYDADKKIVARQTGDSLISAVDENQFVVRNNMYTILPNREEYSIYFINSLFNSSFLTWYYQEIINPEKGETLAEVRKGYLVQLPVPQYNGVYIEESSIEIDPQVSPEDLIVNTVDKSQMSKESLYSCVVISAKKLKNLKEKRHRLNIDLLDYLGNYIEGPKLPDIGLFQPTGSSLLDATVEDYKNLRIGEVRVDRGGTSVTISATARYKPENEDAYKTDWRGYTETEFHEAFTLADLSDSEAALVEAFIPVAIAEAGGFASFRNNATKTNSLLDRLKAITLPDPDDVADDLERYVETKERADELNAKIEKTDRLIDEIVYGLYGLTDEEIEIVESAVTDD